MKTGRIVRLRHVAPTPRWRYVIRRADTVRAAAPARPDVDSMGNLAKHEQLAQRLGAGDAVDSQVPALLKIAHRRFGMRTENAVDL